MRRVRGELQQSQSSFLRVSVRSGRFRPGPTVMEPRMSGPDDSVEYRVYT